MNFRKYNLPLDETWYNRRSREKNPKRNNNLENLLQNPLNSDPENDDHNNFLKYIVSNIFSNIPVPIRKAAVVAGLVGAIAACGGQEITSPVPLFLPLHLGLPRYLPLKGEIFNQLLPQKLLTQ